MLFFVLIAIDRLSYTVFSKIPTFDGLEIGAKKTLARSSL